MREAVEEFPRSCTDVGCYVGRSKYGKTHLALVHLAAFTDGFPSLVIDTVGARNLQHLEHVDTAREAMARVWTERKHACYTPWDESEVTLLVQAAHDLGRVHLMLDEASKWIDARSSSVALDTLLRAAGHRKATVQLTMQHFSGDVPAFLFSCDAAFYVFRTTGRRARARLAEEFEEDDLDAQVRALPRRVALLYPRELRGEPPALATEANAG